MVPSETTSTTACKWCMVCITNSLNKQDGYMGRNKICTGGKKLGFVSSDYSF